MREPKKSFRHESLQDVETIQDMLNAISKGLSNGKLQFSDEEGSITLHPEGLLNLKLTASEDELRRRLDLRISWQVESDTKKNKNLKID